MIAVLENRVKESKVDAIMRKIFGDWKWITNYEVAPGGRIWIVWDQARVEFEVKQVHDQYIARQITIRQCNSNFLFVAVYGKHNIQDRKCMWNDLKGIINGVKWPSVLMGDFNSIMSIEDRVQRNPVQDVEERDFKNFVEEAGLSEMRTIGRYYTWTNNTVHNRIDRILVNAEWIQKWPQMEGIIKQPEFSDHCPLMITMAEYIVQGKRPFKFFNCLANHQKFEEIVRHCWRREHRGNKMQKVWYKLKQ
ncbi:uncharacterized protein [Nicotiana sylvestris]|uniref:uncharacterized protein n=1 Tax=Nicotiana sylvestris TaxID=4096 RepID=UPI00388C6D5E